MQIYEVRISHTARIDMANLRLFLDAMLSFTQSTLGVRLPHRRPFCYC